MAEDAARPVGLRARVSIRRERLPRPGALRVPWVWDDILDAQPPSAQRRGWNGVFVVRHGHGADDADPDVRVGFATVVHSEKSDAPAGRIDVEERVTVEPRVLSPVLRVERAVSRRVQAGNEAGMRMVATGSHALSQRVGGRGGVALQRGADATVGAWAWVSRLAVDTVRALVEAPDRFWAGATAADAHLHRPRERRALLRGFLAPQSLSREGKTAALFLLVAGFLAAALAGTLIVTFLAPGLAPAWRAAVSFFALGVGSTVLFPFFPEFKLREVADLTGAPLAIASVALGMTVGAWMVLFLGDEIHTALRGNLKPGGALSRLLDRAESFSRRHGFWAAFLILSVPLGPDTPVFYTLATVRTPVPQYLLGTILGTLVRFSLFLLVPVLYYDYLMAGYYVR